MSRSRQAKEHREMRKIYLESVNWQNREQALLPLQNVKRGNPGDKLLYQALIVRFEDIQINRWKNKLIAFPKNKTRHEGYTKKELEAEIKHYEMSKEKELCELGKIVYEPVIKKINEQEEQEQQGQQQGQQQQGQQQQGQQQQEDVDGDVIMSGTASIGCKKRRKSKGRKRRRKRTRKRRKSRR